MKYDTRISGWGECALEFLHEDCNFLIIFNDSAPQELADISILHTAGELLADPCVGEEALHTLKELGHCCLSFSGAKNALRPGNIELAGPTLREELLYAGGRLQIL